YNISFNFNTGAYSFTPTAVGIIGVGGPSASWDNDATMTTTDAIHYTLNNVVITAGNFKIRDNGSWAVQFGTAGPTADTPFPSGSAIANGNDMKSETGTYNISFNRTTLEYNFQNALDVDSRNKQVFTVYPNPAVDSWTISSEHEIGEVTLFDVTGKVVNRVQSAETSVALDANGLSKGIYFAKVTSGQTSKTIKLIRK
ncbi:MAG: T9SS type A sorting domain-containing protein, partial [Proteobacteria bacterium]